MQTATEIRGNLKNIKYYAEKIKKAARLQFDMDVVKGTKQGINTGPGSVRFDSLGCIIAASEWMAVYCENIEANLLVAEGQDKKLWGEDYIEEGE